MVREAAPENAEETVLRFKPDMQFVIGIEPFALDDTVLSCHFRPQQYSGTCTCASHAYPDR